MTHRSPPLSLVDPDKTPPGGIVDPGAPPDLGTPEDRIAAKVWERIRGAFDALTTDLRAETADRRRGERLGLEGQTLLLDGQHRILADLAAIRGRVDQADIGSGELLAWQAKAERRVGELDERVRRIESQRPSGLSGAMAAVTAVSARASQSEEAIVQQLREANEALRDERDARIAEDRRRLDAEIEAARTRRAWVTRAVVFLCGAGGLALIGLAGRACGG